MVAKRKLKEIVLNMDLAFGLFLPRHPTLSDSRAILLEIALSLS